MDVWVHLNCALWSLEVYETLNGALMNVDVAVKRGTITVSRCSMKIQSEPKSFVICNPSQSSLILAILVSFRFIITSGAFLPW